METIQIPAWLGTLAREFLRDLSDRMSNAGCNDYDLPEWVGDEARAVLARAALGDSDGGMDGDDLLHYDWIVVDAVVSLLAPKESAHD